MMCDYKIEYCDNDNEVCIIPVKGIPLDDVSALQKHFGKKGYKNWCRADERRGIRLVKKINIAKEEAIMKRFPQPD